MEFAALIRQMGNLSMKPDKQPSYLCQDCGRSLSTYAAWYNHIRRVHNHSQVYACPSCPGQRFHTKHQRDAHFFDSHS